MQAFEPQAVNVEQQLIEAESVGAEAPEDEGDETLADKFNAEDLHDAMMAEATRQAEKSLKKNKNEISRLKTHAENCLFEGNFEGYSYAIKKLRDYYKQPYTEELVKTMWATSRQALFDMVAKAKAEQAK